MDRCTGLFKKYAFGIKKNDYHTCDVNNKEQTLESRESGLPSAEMVILGGNDGPKVIATPTAPVIEYVTHTSSIVELIPDHHKSDNHSFS